MADTEARLKKLEKGLNRLLRVLPPDDSPFRDNLLCHLRKPPIPCLCRGWIELLHGGRKDEQGNYYESPQVVKACIVELLPWLISQNIVTNNSAAKDFIGAQKDLSVVATALRLVVPGLMGLTSESTITHAPMTGSVSAGLLEGETLPIPLQAGGIDHSGDADAGADGAGAGHRITDSQVGPDTVDVLE